MMRRHVFLIALAFAAPAHAVSAETITCEAFKQHLADLIHETGDKVAIPSEYKTAWQSDDSGEKRYEYAGIVGITGNLHCETADRFHSIDIDAEIDSDDPRENGFRIIRAKALAGAAACAAAKMQTAKCQAGAASVFDKAYRTFMAAKRRGEKYPSGDDYQDLANKVQIEVLVSQGSLSYSVFAPKDQAKP